MHSMHSMHGNSRFEILNLVRQANRASWRDTRKAVPVDLRGLHGVTNKVDPTQDIARGARGFFENTAGYRPRGPRGFRKNLASSPGQLAKTQSPRAPRSLFCIRSFDTIWNPNWTKISCIEQSVLDFFQWKQSIGPRSTWVPVLEVPALRF